LRRILPVAFDTSATDRFTSMHATGLDFNTLLLVYVVARMIQAGGLVYVYSINRCYAPARLWALGSSLIAAGTLLIGLRGTIPLPVSVLSGNAMLFTGMLVFAMGVMQIGDGRPRWRLGWAIVATGYAGMSWFLLVEPSIVIRTVIFTAVMGSLGGWAGVSVWRGASGRFAGMRRFLGALLLLEPTFILLRLYGISATGTSETLASNGFQSAFIFGLMVVAALVTLALAFITNLMDNDRRERAETVLHDEIARSARLASVLDTALQNMSQGLAIFGPDGRLITCNDQYMALYNLAASDARPGMELVDIARLRVGNGIYNGPDPEAYIEERRQIARRMLGEPTDTRAELNDGRTIRVASRPLPGGGWVMTNEDVSEQKRREDEVAFLASHDILTGLANRSRFQALVAEAVEGIAIHNRRFNILMLDLDRFKSVNDTMGHAAGDALLKEVACRLKGAVRANDVVARLGGDEFAIIQTAPRAEYGAASDADYREGAQALAERILEAFDEPVDLGTGAVFAGTSIGVAFAPEHGTDGYELLKKADFALYAAKSAGRNTYRLFEPQMMAAAHAQTLLEAELRLALAREEFELHYQPIFDMGTGRPAIVEALVRWRHPHRGLLAPDAFLRAAEDSGLIIPLGDWIMHRACHDAMAWPAELRVAVNLSTVQFRKSNLVDVVLFALADSGLPPERLEVEVTESVLLGSDPEYLDTLQQLKNLGVAIALDDFGTGHSSLGYLNKFQFDRIKIDRSFVGSIVDNPNSMAIVSAVGGLVRQLDMAATAEGVETEEQFAILRAAGVTYAQGYLFGRPGPVATLRFDGYAPGDGAAATIERGVA